MPRLFPSLHGYRRPWLRSDLVAGLTVWAVLVPEALAYATIAGVSPVVGLYAAPGALILYAALGSSRYGSTAGWAYRRMPPCGAASLHPLRDSAAALGRTLLGVTELRVPLLGAPRPWIKPALTSPNMNRPGDAARRSSSLNSRGRVAAHAVRLIARWALTDLQLVRLELTCGPDNRASQRVAERCGFIREGLLRSHSPFKGSRRDTVMFSLLPGELR